jgi:hypothetical protein
MNASGLPASVLAAIMQALQNVSSASSPSGDPVVVSQSAMYTVLALFAYQILKDVYRFMACRTPYLSRMFQSPAASAFVGAVSSDVSSDVATLAAGGQVSVGAVLSQLSSALSTALAHAATAKAIVTPPGGTPSADPRWGSTSALAPISSPQ